MCKLFDDRMFNNIVISMYSYIPMLNITSLPYSINTKTQISQHMVGQEPAVLAAGVGQMGCFILCGVFFLCVFFFVLFCLFCFFVCCWFFGFFFWFFVVFFCCCCFCFFRLVYPVFLF